MSCGKILDEMPKSFVTPTNFYKTAADAESAVAGAYGALHSTDLYLQHIYDMLVYTSGEFSPQTNRIGDNLSWTASWSDLERQWKGHYSAINIANAAIKYIPGIQMDEDTKKELIAEAKLIRALLYFNLVQWFGDIPLHTEPTQSIKESSLSRSSVRDVYNLIVEDLTFAENNLAAGGVFPGNGRFTRGAAIALLAKVYLTMSGAPIGDISKLSLARDNLLKLVDTTNPAVGKGPFNFKLEPDYVNLYYQITKPGYIKTAAKENGPEGVMEINFSGVSGINGGIFPQDYFGTAILSKWMVNRFDSGDYRREISSVIKTNDPRGPINRQMKFPRTSTTWNWHENNWYVIRFADVLLMLAEVENELYGPTTGALKCLNSVRTRARNAGGVMRVKPENIVLNPTIDKDAFREIIYNERIVELNAEGHLWFDMIRTGRLGTILRNQDSAQNYHRNYTDKLKLFPIPQSQIDVNPLLTQNAGY